MPVVIIVIMLLAVCAAPMGCDGARAASCSVGMCDEAPPPPVCVDIVCDRSVGSTCSPETLAKTIDGVLEYAAERPGSRVRLWVMGATVDKTVVVGEQTITAAKRSSERSRKAHAARITASAHDVLLTGAAQTFKAPGARRSPIAESLSRVAMAEAGGLPRRLVVVTDAREVSALGDFECGRLPSDAQFAELLRRLSLLAPGLLREIDVDFAFVSGSSIPGRGCAVTVGRETRLRALWTAALNRAGAKRVRVTSGPPDLAEREN